MKPDFCLLTDKLPDALEIEGKPYRVRTDFRVWIGVARLFENAALSAPARLAKALALCYIDLPPSLASAAEQMKAFYAGGAPEDERRAQGADGGIRAPKSFSFSQDAPLIYAAFWAQYGIDLQKARLHWFAFRALFGALSKEQRFCETVALRTADLSKIQSPTRRAAFRRAQAAVALSCAQGRDSMEEIEALFEK
jgi:hypothetical protein